MDYRNKEIKATDDKINYFCLVLCDFDSVYDLEIIIPLIWFYLSRFGWRKYHN